MNLLPVQVRRALLSVSDKTGLLELANTLIKNKVEIISTGGTATTLKSAGIPVTLVSEVTGFPEMMEGRVKTLHPKIHGAILGKRDQHELEAKNQGVQWIDLLVCNLYPFAQTIRSTNDREKAIENIDVGGPAMIRAAAKNQDWVCVLTDPSDYVQVAESLNQGISVELRRFLAAKAFAHTSAYDARIASYLSTTDFPHEKVLGFELKECLRYGENPHQQAAWYVNDSNPFQKQLQGKALSYNNIADASAALGCLQEFSEPACVVVKHANPCGVAIDESITPAFLRAFAADHKSAFGGIVALNRPCTVEIAEFLAGQFVEVVIALDFSEDVLKIFSQKPNYRLLTLGGVMPKPDPWVFKSVQGGLLFQSRDDQVLTQADLKVVTERKPSQQELQDALFTWKVLKHLKSNAILVAKQGVTLGVGAGQVSRVDAVEVALQKSRGIDEQAVLASDAFFPFADSIELIAKSQIKLIVQPGGSLRDKEVIEACNRHNIAMVLTGKRCFNH